MIENREILRMIRRLSLLAIIFCVGFSNTAYSAQNEELNSRRSIVRKPTVAPLLLKKELIRVQPMELAPPLLSNSGLVQNKSIPSVMSRKRLIQYSDVTTKKRPIRHLASTTLPDMLAKQQSEKGFFTLSQYLDKIVDNSTTIANGGYDAQVDILQNALLQNRYAFDVSFQAFVGANQSPTTNEGLGTTLGGRFGIGAKKTLYDGSRSYTMDMHRTLSERVSKYRVLSAKQNARLLGIEMYLQMLELQSRQKYMVKYKEIVESLYQATMSKYEKGVSDNAYVHLNAEMDKVTLEKLATNLAYDLYKSEIAFKQAANLSSNQKYILDWPHVKINTIALESLQQKAIENSSRIAEADAVFRFKKGEIMSAKGAEDWKIDFDSFAGAGYSNTKSETGNSTSQGLNWSVGLSAIYPLMHGANDLEVERKTVEALKEKNNLLQAEREVILRVNTLYANNEREARETQLLMVQKELAERQSKIARSRYENGLDPYSVYAISMKRVFEIEEELIAVQSRQTRNMYELQLFTGGLDQ